MILLSALRNLIYCILNICFILLLISRFHKYLKCTEPDMTTNSQKVVSGIYIKYKYSDILPNNNMDWHSKLYTLHEQLTVTSRHDGFVFVRPAYTCASPCRWAAVLELGSMSMLPSLEALIHPWEMQSIWLPSGTSYTPTESHADKPV